MDQETTVNEEQSFWEKYQHYLFSIVLVSLMYVAYLYFSKNSCNVSTTPTKVHPLGPFYPPSIGGVVESGLKMGSDVVQDVVSEVVAGSGAVTGSV